MFDKGRVRRVSMEEAIVMEMDGINGDGGRGVGKLIRPLVSGADDGKGREGRYEERKLLGASEDD